MRNALIGVAVSVGVAVLAWQAWLGRVSTTTPVAETTVDTFLANHWNHPMPPQGTPPADRPGLEASLDAGACAQCHAEQWGAWRTSLHSQAMGPGVQWQLRLMDQTQGNRCLRCHAPLAEQKALYALERGWPGAPEASRPEFVPADLHRQGVSCAVCHVRGHDRFGPPARATSTLQGPAHDGFTAHQAFEDSRFCSTCHQFPEDGPRLAGKLHEDTFAQWRASKYAGNRSCQQCHMPDRQHVFRGIHDPDMVRKAVTLQLVALRDGGRGVARVTVANTGAGHHFPTYMVPKVYVSLDLLGPRGETRHVGTEVIGWQVDVGITREDFDTRIPAGGRHEFERLFELPAESGWRIEASIDVAPREHYERVFADTLEKASLLDDETAAQLRMALSEANATRYKALRINRALDGLKLAVSSAEAGRCLPDANC